MREDTNLTAQKLLKVLGELKRLHKNGPPVGGLTHSEAVLMFAIEKHVKSEKDGIKTSELSHILYVAAPTITQQVNTLENRGYVERNADKNDRRAVRIKLTTKGEEVLNDLHKSFHESIDGLAEYLGYEKTDQLSELLSEVFVYFKEVRK
jgi:DNA-binding MarR family transcriptional regulator